MEVPVELRLGKLIAQKDAYRRVDDDVWESDDFAESKAARAEIVYLKRIVVTGTAKVGDREGPFEFIIGMRGGILTATVDPTCPLTPIGLMMAIRLEYQQFTAGKEPAPDSRKNLGPNTVLGVAPNPMKLAEVLHAARDARVVHVAIPDGWVSAALR